MISCMKLDWHGRKSYYGHMKTASITEAKNNLSALIDGLKSGSSVLIVDRGKPVAVLEPVMGGRVAKEDVRLARLVREGLVRPRRSPLPRALLEETPPVLSSGASIVEALLDERREGR